VTMPRLAMPGRAKARLASPSLASPCPAVPCRTQPGLASARHVEGSVVTAPFDLLLVDDYQNTCFIDVEEHAWHAKYADWLRRPGWWLLRRKGTNAVVLTVRVAEGDQPYYTARHVGTGLGSPGQAEIIAYGIGKKCADGSMVRLWVMPDGVVVGGEDVDRLGVLMVRARGM
jgi:hypothetical protein